MPGFTAIDALDILIVSFVLYKLVMMLRGTRATSIIKGLIFLFVGSALSQWLGLPTVSWLLQQGTTVILVALPVVFYPELRRALERLGRGSIFRSFTSLGHEEVDKLADEILRAIRHLITQRHGALIVIEKDVGLEDFIETGVLIEALVQADLLTTIFQPTTALHDGAVIIRGDRIIAAGCFLPLTDTTSIDSQFGTRHRAAVGLSEQSDAFIIVVSEERGVISVASDGYLHTAIDEAEVRERMRSAFITETPFVFRKTGVS